MNIRQIQEELHHAHSWIENICGINLYEQSQKAIQIISDTTIELSSYAVKDTPSTITSVKVTVCALSVLFSGPCFAFASILGMTARTLNSEWGNKISTFEESVYETCYSTALSSELISMDPHNEISDEKRRQKLNERALKLISASAIVTSSFILLPSPITKVMGLTAGLLFGREIEKHYLDFRERQVST